MDLFDLFESFCPNEDEKDEEYEDNGDYTKDDWYGGPLNPNWEPGDDDDCGIN